MVGVGLFFYLKHNNVGFMYNYNVIIKYIVVYVDTIEAFEN